MGTRIRIDYVMRPRSSSRGHNTSASITVTVTPTASVLKLSATQMMKYSFIHISCIHVSSHFRVKTGKIMTLMVQNDINLAMSSSFTP